MIRRLIITVLCLSAAALLGFLVLRGTAPAGRKLVAPANRASTPREQAVDAPVAAPAPTRAGNPQAAVSAPGLEPSTFPTTAAAPVTPFLLGAADKSPAMEPTTVLDNVRVAIQQYGSRFGGNPVGTNPEITRALNGGNSKQVKFITEESGLRINGRGELVDYWGTPFFFHQLSASVMEIHSAGPDRIMWTADDLVTK